LLTLLFVAIVSYAPPKVDEILAVVLILLILVGLLVPDLQTSHCRPTAISARAVILDSKAPVIIQDSADDVIDPSPPKARARVEP
jgi:hypothetical protein